MKKQFVPFKIAKELRDLGFNKSCFAFYAFDTLIIKKAKFPIYEDNTLAPLWQQVIDWFRDVHHIHISTVLVVRIHGFHEFAGVELLWRYSLSDIVPKTSKIDQDSDERYKSEPEARKAAILKAIEIVKKGKKR